MTWSAVASMPELTAGRVLACAGAVLAGGWVTVLMGTAHRTSYEVWFPLLVLPVLVLTGVAVLHSATRTWEDSWFFQVAVLALLLKLASGLARYVMAYVVYDGSDAGYYYDFGVEAHLEYRRLDFSAELPFGGIPGTGFLAAVTAAVFAVTGPTMTGGFVVFAFLGFWGQWCAFLAFRRAVPEGHQRRYAAAVLLLPTLVFWPSALGKDAWMQLWLGVALLGASHVATGRPVRGLLVFALGAGAAALVRPHVAALVVLAMVTAVVLRRARRLTATTPLVRVLLGLGTAAVAAWAARQGASFVGAESLSLHDLQAAADAAGGRTEQGGSEFTPVPLLSPLGPPAALLTVLYRPLPFEASSVQVLLAALEGAALLWLTWCWRRSLGGALLRLRTSLFCAMAAVGTALFVLAFAEFANFGILARQRSQFLPLFLALLCAPDLRTTLPVGPVRAGRTSSRRTP